MPPIALPIDRLGDWRLPELNDLRKAMPEEADKIAALPWIADGLSKLTKDLYAARGLVRMAEQGYLDTLIDQQWVIDGTNPQGLENLARLDRSPEVMDHPALMDGIDEQESLLMTIAFDPYLPGAMPIGDLLDISKTTIEERTITLPLAGETGLAIIRHQASAEWTMPALEQAVRQFERFIGYPFPARRVVLWLPVTEVSYGGALVGGVFITIPLSESEAAAERRIRGLLAHELAHYYWHGSTPWVFEGAAEFMTSLFDGTAHDPISEVFVICEYDNIGDWEAQYDTTQLGGTAACDYELGEGLFRDLYQNMDEVQFRLSFRRLHLRKEFFGVQRGRCDLAVTERLDMCNLRESFTAFVSPEDRPRIEAIIDRWHYGETP